MKIPFINAKRKKKRNKKRNKTQERNKREEKNEYPTAWNIIAQQVNRTVQYSQCQQISNIVVI